MKLTFLNMCQMRYDHAQPGGGKEILVRVETTGDSTAFEQVYKTAQKVARGLEEQGHSIDPEEENQDEEEAGEEI
jgi:hypothetical protein